MTDNKPQKITDSAFEPSTFLITFALVVLVILAIGIYYWLAIRKLKPLQQLKGFPLVVFLYVQSIENLVDDILGPRFKPTVPYFVYLLTFLLVSNALAILGLEQAHVTLAVPLALSIVTFLGTIVCGFKFRKWNYTNEFISWISYKGIRLFFIPDPMKIVSELSRVLSLSFRLWGNTLAGGLILGLLYSIAQSWTLNNPNLSYLNFFSAVAAGFLVAPFHFYFDIFDGLVQPTIFLMLTLSYWSIAADLDESEKMQISENKPRSSVKSSAIIRELILRNQNQN